MATINEMIQQAVKDGYTDDDAPAKVCQDIVLKALSESSLCRHATIKGGVVMRSITGNTRRATQDMDIDFIRYSLSDESIHTFIEKLNCLPDFHIVQVGNAKELKQQDYHGKRIYVEITDNTGDHIRSKIDMGVHKDLSIEQEEYCFDIACFDDGANLLINSKEQIFTEKLKSLLRLGRISTRYKDVFDLYYLSEHVDPAKLMDCIDSMILSNPDVRQNTIEDVCNRLQNTFSAERFASHLSEAKNNWLDMDSSTVTASLIDFIRSLEK